LATVLQVETRVTVGELELAVTLSIPPGQCLALAGPSGAGKTTVLRTVAGLVHPASGRVSCGPDVWLDTTRGINLAPEQRRCGYVFQELALFPNMTVLENVAFPLSRLKRIERRQRALGLLERFGVEKFADVQPRTLSGGEKQRVALARALARRPLALLLDEPLSALDASTRARAARELSEALREVEVPTLLVTHDFLEAAQLSHRVGIVDSGKVVQEGAPSELAARPRSAFVADFTGAVVLIGNARAGEGGLTIVDLEGGGAVVSTDSAAGPAAASVFPWEIEIERSDTPHSGSARNHLAAEVRSITTVGNRVRLGLSAGQQLTAEITRGSATRLGLEVGSRVTATWKAAATRLVALE
jgi:molybdate transport system ATP-binding protein